MRVIFGSHLYSYSTTTTGWGVLPRYVFFAGHGLPFLDGTCSPPAGNKAQALDFLGTPNPKPYNPKALKAQSPNSYGTASDLMGFLGAWDLQEHQPHPPTRFRLWGFRV